MITIRELAARKYLTENEKQMTNRIKYVKFIIGYSFVMMPQLVFAEDTNETIEPSVKGPSSTDLLADNTLDAWKLPSDHWHLDEKTIVANTGKKKLRIPEWLYTKKRFGDFEFTCELKLTGDDRRNTGIYFRVNTILFQGKKKFEAPSGYEFDVAYYDPKKKINYRGSLGDWYARPHLRIFPDQNIINEVYKSEEWNRMTIRARANRLEYWINGIKIMDYLDHNPKASRAGVIGLQIHDGAVMKVECRNIYVRSLERHKKASKVMEGNSATLRDQSPSR